MILFLVFFLFAVIITEYRVLNSSSYISVYRLKNCCFFMFLYARRACVHVRLIERAMCPSCVLINHATRDPAVRDELHLPSALFPVDIL